jgi:hypothetical protein
MHIVYPEDLMSGKPVARLLDTGRDGAVANVHGKLRSEEPMVVSNLAGRQIIIDAPNTLVLVMRFFMMGSTLVQAAVAGPQGVETDPDTGRFLSSLKVVAP